MHPVTIALGATSLIEFTLLKPLASPTHKALYHWMGPVSGMVLPMLLDFVAVWLLLTLLLLWTQKHPPFDSLVLSLFGVSASLFLADLYRLHHFPHGSAVAIGVASALCVLLIAQILFHAQPFLQRATEFAATLLGFIAISGAVMLVEALFFSWQARNLNVDRPLHPHPQSQSDAPPKGRIIWIVFDELSYRQVFEHPYRDLSLPAFAELSKNATVFSHIVPSGLYTDEVLPSLITGREYDRIRVPAAGWPLQMHDRSLESWTTLDPHQTVFQDALAAGYRTAVAGWYIPYCRILPEVLDHCFWTDQSNLPEGTSPVHSILDSGKRAFLNLLPSAVMPASLSALQRDRTSATDPHERDYTSLVAEGDKMLNDPSITFLLLHMPIPHPGGIYNRHTGSLDTAHSTYLDNLALCDLYLGHVRQELERIGTWDDTTLLVMGDHSWRVHLGLVNTPEWTEEERIASDGAKFDDRPLYLVKLPHQRMPLRVDAPFRSIRTRELLDQVMARRLQTPEQLAAWAR